MGANHGGFNKKAFWKASMLSICDATQDIHGGRDNIFTFSKVDFGDQPQVDLIMTWQKDLSHHDLSRPHVTVAMS